MDSKIRILGETFDQVVSKSVGTDYAACGNTLWPTDEFMVEAARDYYSVAVPGADDVSTHKATAADYGFTRQKGYVLGPPQEIEKYSRAQLVRLGFVGVYRNKMSL